MVRFSTTSHGPPTPIGSLCDDDDDDDEEEEDDGGCCYFIFFFVARPWESVRRGLPKQEDGTASPCGPERPPPPQRKTLDDDDDDDDDETKLVDKTTTTAAATTTTTTTKCYGREVVRDTAGRGAVNLLPFSI